MGANLGQDAPVDRLVTFDVNEAVEWLREGQSEAVLEEFNQQQAR